MLIALPGPLAQLGERRLDKPEVTGSSPVRPTYFTFASYDARAMATSTEPVVARVPVPVRGLHLGVLYALAVSQPLLNLLGTNADFFTSRQLSSGKVLWFGLAVEI